MAGWCWGATKRINDQLEKLQMPGNTKLFIGEWPGPLALHGHADELYHTANARGTDLVPAACLVTRYGSVLSMREFLLPPLLKTY